MITKEEIISFMEAQGYDQSDYDKNWSAVKLQDLLYWLETDFYIESLTSFAWEWEENLYLSYYDENANAVILSKDMEWSYHFDNNEDVADAILELQDIVEKYKSKFLFLKTIKNELTDNS